MFNNVTGGTVRCVCSIWVPAHRHCFISFHYEPASESFIITTLISAPNWSVPRLVTLRQKYCGFCLCVAPTNFIAWNHSGMLPWRREALYTKLCSNITAREILQTERSFYETRGTWVRILGTWAQQGGVHCTEASEINSTDRPPFTSPSRRHTSPCAPIFRPNSVHTDVGSDKSRDKMQNWRVVCADVRHKDLEEESAKPRASSSPLSSMELPYVVTVSSHTGTLLKIRQR
jgi:hypothetical protein